MAKKQNYFLDYFFQNKRGANHYLPLQSRFIFTILGLLFSTLAYANIAVVAAENFYGDVAQQLGQPYVSVISVINNPNQDPHLFSSTPKTAVLIENAHIIIANGLGYDAWMNRNIQEKKMVFINVAKLMHKKNHSNPHIWYDPKTMPFLAKKLTQEYIRLDPEHKKKFQENLKNFMIQSEQYKKSVLKARKIFFGITVTATEPVLGYLTQALGLKMLNKKFQKNRMNEIDLTPHEIINFEKSLQSPTSVKLLIYNNQVSDTTTEHLKLLALQNHISVLGVTETMPANTHYYQWMNHILEHLSQKLSPVDSKND